MTFSCGVSMIYCFGFWCVVLCACLWVFGSWVFLAIGFDCGGGGLGGFGVACSLGSRAGVSGGCFGFKTRSAWRLWFPVGLV